MEAEGKAVRRYLGDGIGVGENRERESRKQIGRDDQGNAHATSSSSSRGPCVRKRDRACKSDF